MTDERSTSPFFHAIDLPAARRREDSGRNVVLEKIDLSNGAVLLCEPVPGSEVVAVGFWFRHGSRD
jgi:hypothetical protein